MNKILHKHYNINTGTDFDVKWFIHPIRQKIDIFTYFDFFMREQWHEAWYNSTVNN